MKFILFFTTVFTVSFFVQAQEENKDPSKWTPEDIIFTESARSIKISSDNNLLLWSKRHAIKEKDKFVSHLYLTRLNNKENNEFVTTQLTYGNESNHSAVFAPDNKSIYFLSSRDKGNKLWKLSLYGGEAKKVKEFKNGISNLQFKDKNTLLFVSNDGKTLYEQQLEDKKDNVKVIEDSVHWKASRVYAFNLKNKTITRITDNTKPITTYVVSKDGNWLFYGMQRSTSYASDAQKDPFYYLKNLATGKEIQIIKDLEFPVGSVQFTNDNAGFYFTSEYASDPEWNGAGITELYYYTIASNTYKKVNLQWPLGIARGYHVANNNVVVSLANKARLAVGFYKKDGNSWQKQSLNLNEKKHHTVPLAVSNDGTKIVYQYATASKLPKFYVASLKNNKLTNEEEFIKLNQKLQKKSITKSEVMVWKGYNDDEVTGILYYPENYDPTKKYPLMLSIHGGPAGVDLDFWSERWSTYPNILAQKGMFVLKPNYHGSSNHGLAFVESIKGNYYEPELEDITKAINILVKDGKVDANKLGVMGWSNGAILTTMLTVRYPDMFKVAAPGAGDVNWTSDYGTCRFGVSFDQSYFGGAPWDDVNGKFYNENYIIKSPLFEIEKIKTPTIIFHGSEDRAVPRDQGWEYYRGLQQVGKAPVRFLWFPGQPHGLQKITHQLRKMNEEIKWIETYLLEKDVTENVAFKKKSPLAQLIEVDKAKSTQGLFGVMVNGKLIPETALTKKDSIAIGVFEVTNAQFKAFNPNHTFIAGLDNYPVTVTKEQANEYVKWLSDLTGETYRLPTKDEAKKLHKKAHKVAPKEITLNYWAGYDITKDEVTMLLEKVKELKATLFKKVGKKSPVTIGDAKVYDLGGNVAEYYSDGIYGYSAYDFVDKFNDAMINSKHVGIRVIKE